MKLFTKWFKLLGNNRGEVGEDGEDEPTVLEDALGDQIGDPQPEGDPEPKKEEDPKPEAEPKKEEDPKPAAEDLIDIEGYKGKNRRGSRFEGEERRSDIISKRDNIDLDFDFGVGDKTSKKITVAEVKQTLQWLQNNKPVIDAGITMNGYAQKNPDFAKVLDAVIKGSFNEKNEFNSEFATKVLGAIEKKEEIIEDKKDAVDDEIAKIQKLLDDGDIDPDSAQGEVLKSNMVSLKAMKGQLGTALKKLDEVSNKFGNFEDTQKKTADAKVASDHETEVSRIRGMFSEQLATLTNKEDEKAYKFFEGEQSEFEALTKQGVGSAVKDLKLKPGEIYTDKQFKEFVVTSAKAAYEKITKKREAIEQDYIKRKGLEPKKKDKEKEIPKDESDMDIGSLTDDVSAILAEKE